MGTNFNIKIRILKDFLVSITLAGPPYILYAITIGAEGIFYSTFIFYLLAVSSWWFYKKNEIVKSASLLSISVWLAVSGTIIFSGGIASPVILWFIPPVFTCIILLPRIYGIVLTAITTVFLLMLSFTNLFNIDAFNEVVHLSSYPYFQALSTTVPLIVIAYFGYIIIKEYDQDQLTIKTQNDEIKSSIEYAKHIVESTMPDIGILSEKFQDLFLIFLPKDIVSGDFYWYSMKEQYAYVAIADCTGHGVPGAFMSIIGKCLFKSVNAQTGSALPSEVLDNLNQALKNEFNTSKDDKYISDGMDLALCRIDLTTNELVFAGAMNPLILVNKDGVEQIKGDRIPIGNYYNPLNKKFTDRTIQLYKGDCLYMFSDGFQDQFGGEYDKKMGKKRLLKLISKVKDLSMGEQKEEFVSTFCDWKGDNEQVDDVIFIGIKI